MKYFFEKILFLLLFSFSISMGAQDTLIPLVIKNDRGYKLKLSYTDSDGNSIEKIVVPGEMVYITEAIDGDIAYAPYGKWVEYGNKAIGKISSVFSSKSQDEISEGSIKLSGDLFNRSQAENPQYNVAKITIQGASWSPTSWYAAPHAIQIEPFEDAIHGIYTLEFDNEKWEEVEPELGDIKDPMTLWAQALEKAQAKKEDKEVGEYPGNKLLNFLFPYIAKRGQASFERAMNPEESIKNITEFASGRLTPNTTAYILGLPKIEQKTEIVHEGDELVEQEVIEYSNNASIEHAARNLRNLWARIYNQSEGNSILRNNIDKIIEYINQAEKEYNAYLKQVDPKQLEKIKEMTIATDTLSKALESMKNAAGNASDSGAEEGYLSRDEDSSLEEELSDSDKSSSLEEGDAFQISVES